VSISLDLPDELLDALADRVIERLALGVDRAQHSPWLNVEQAAQHLATTPDSIRALVKRGQLAVHRSETGRLRFRRDELDEHAIAGDAA
jgi:excisionase family DNA binding protein